MKVFIGEQNEKKIAFIQEDKVSITYEQLKDEINIISKIVLPRRLVFIFTKNSIGSVVSYVSCLNSNVVPLLLKSDIDIEMRNKLINIYKPNYLFIPYELKDYYQGYSSIWNGWDYCLLYNSDIVDIKIDDSLALLLTTSGSTGSPKLVKQSYDNILSNARSIASYLELNENERPITTLPMNYTYGLSIINSHLLVGATILLTDKPIVSREFWDFCKREKATSFGGVPYTYEMLKRMKFFKMDLPYLKTMTQAGGKLSPNLHKEFAEYAIENDKHFVVMYGQTEATARMSYLPWKDSLDKYGSIGIAIPDGKFWLMDVDGSRIERPNITGELVYEGPNVTMGYAECREDLAKGDERGGVLYTGDMAKFDEDGYYYIVGRKKRFLKVYGNRFNLDETEQLIKEKFEGIECAVTGIDDHVHIFITSDDKSMLKNIKEYISNVTKLNIVAFNTHFIDEIPKNDSGKILYKELDNFF